MLTTSAFRAPEPVEIDTSALSAEELQLLRKDDPFLYYSIPAVRRATFRLDEPDLSLLVLEESSSTIVKRSTRVSVECHTDLLMEDLLTELEQEDDNLISRHIDDEIFKLLGLQNMCRQ